MFSLRGLCLGSLSLGFQVCVWLQFSSDIVNFSANISSNILSHPTPFSSPLRGLIAQILGRLQLSHSLLMLCSVLFSLLIVFPFRFHCCLQVHSSFLSHPLICCWSHPVCFSFHTLQFSSLEVKPVSFLISSLSLLTFLNTWNPVLITVTATLSVHSNVWIWPGSDCFPFPFDCFAFSSCL